MALALPHLTVSAQVSLRGRVIDENRGIPYATVLLTNPDTSLEKGVITDDTGTFTMESVRPGQYRLSVSAIGYGKFDSDSIVVAQHDVELPTVTLRELATELQEIVVAAEKPLFEQLPDRVVANVQASPAMAGNTVLEALQKLPGVVINRQSNSISLNGRSGVRIMINDKIVQVSGDLALQMLEGLTTADVERIELIHAPPSRYDAEGNGGIIHIVMKEKTDNGTNASLSAIGGVKWAEVYGLNASINHRSHRIGYFFDYAYLRSHNLHRFNGAHEYFDNRSWTSSYREIFV